MLVIPLSKRSVNYGALVLCACGVICLVSSYHEGSEDAITKRLQKRYAVDIKVWGLLS